MDGIDGEEAEKQYHSVAVFTLGVENASKRLRQHVLGKKLMSEDELQESLHEMEEMMQACRNHTVHNFVSLDSDAIARIDDEVNELIRETYGEVSDEEESDKEETSSPLASPKPKQKAAKGKPGPKGKGKSSTSTSNGQDRPASQAGPRDDDKEDGIISVSDDEDDDGSSLDETLVVKKRKVPRCLIDPLDQLELFEEQAEESRNLVLSARNDLRTGKRGRFAVNLILVPCPSPLEQRRQYMLVLCTETLPGVDLIRKLDQMEDGLVILLDTNQDIYVSVKAKQSEATARIIRGGSNAARLQRLDRSVNPRSASSDTYLAGVRAYNEASSTNLVARADGHRVDKAIISHLTVHGVVKNFLHYTMYLKSGYVAFYYVPLHELIKSSVFPKSYRKHVRKLYGRVCKDVSFDDSTESLTFVLALTKYLHSFPAEGDLSKDELFAAQTFFHIKKAMAQYTTVWSEKVDPFSIDHLDGEGLQHSFGLEEGGGDVGDEECRHFSRLDSNDNDAKDRRASINVVNYMVCGPQISKLLSKEKRFQQTELFHSLVLRCSINDIKEYGAGILDKPFLESGASVLSTNVLKNIEVELYDASSECIIIYEANRLVAYNLDDSDEETEEKNTLAFDNIAFGREDDSNDDGLSDDDLDG